MTTDETRMAPQGTEGGLDPRFETPFDQALRQHFQDEPEPDDDGFSWRVMAAVPERQAQLQPGRGDWIEWAQWVAMSLAGCGVAALWPAGDGGGDGGGDAAQLVAAYAWMGLLAFWAIPSRWSRGW